MTLRGKQRPGRVARPWSVAGALVLVACGSGGEQGEGIESNLEIYSWWTSSGEEEALQALLNVYSSEYPEVKVTNAAASDPTTARDRLRQRMERGEPPDSFQAISGVDLLSWVQEGQMQSLDDMADAFGWEDVFPERVLDTVRYEGSLYAVPANIERDNNLYYNIEVLEEFDIEPPESLEDFYLACDVLEAGDVTPLAFPAAGWVIALVVFENLMPAVLGGEYYEAFFAGDADLTGDELERLFTELSSVVACSDIQQASGSWPAGGDSVRGGEAAFFVMGDWAKGYFEGGRDAAGRTVERWVALEDFGVLPAFGSGDYFVFNSAVFGLPRGAQHQNAAEAFLGIVGSERGQAAFNPVKGSVPARTDVNLEEFDDVVRQASADFEAAAAEEHRLLPGYASLTPFVYQKEINPSLLVFSVGGERARELDPENVPATEAEIPPLDLDYILGKVRIAYPILQE